MERKFLNISGKKNQCGQAGGTNGIPFGNGFGGVSDSIQRIGDSTDTFIHLSHFGNTTGVVGNGAVSIDGNDHTGHGKHGHGGHGNAIKTGKTISGIYGDTDGDNRSGSGLHTDGQTGDDVGAVTGGGSIGNAFDRTIFTGVVFSDDNDHDS